MEKLAASLGSKMSGSSPETLNKIPGMEVIIVIIIIVIILIIIIIITTIMMTNVQEAVSKGEAVPTKALQDLRHALVFSLSLFSTGAATTIILINNHNHEVALE